MSSVTKRSRAKRIRLPLEIIDTILQYLDPILHAKVVGLTTRVKCRLLRDNNVEDYLKLTPASYHPTTDQFICNYLGITNQPIAPYLVPLLSFGKASCAFFNKCIPEDVRIVTLNWPLPSLENFLSKQFLWYKLARKLIEHERRMDRCVTPSTVQINLYDDNEDYLNCFNCFNCCKDNLVNFNCCIVDCNINDLNRCPDLQIDVHLDDNIISLYLYFLFRIYRIVKE
ncbi:late expression factor-7 [Plutella xylostella multiple nucleopolyhedrovirus]|uniref:Late expression factor-7 n=1 Tax=Plutella xylostella multiple nucleopolyhedrovirus TaxID=379891 RepID=Q0GYA0_9ABAC|nr:late expression factor-7 [Plutella xylostella multiple nucleopolyhedrovirus]